MGMGAKEKIYNTNENIEEGGTGGNPPFYKKATITQPLSGELSWKVKALSHARSGTEVLASAILKT